MTPKAPRLAVLTCIDGRINVDAVLELAPGDAQFVRNAGGVATDDAIRSLVISQRMRGTREVVVIGHTDCGLYELDADGLTQRLVAETGHNADLDFGHFSDVDEHVRQQVQQIRSHPWTMDVPIRGLVYDVATGETREVI